MRCKAFHILSGIEPGTSGVGQLINALANDTDGISEKVVIHHGRPREQSVGKLLKRGRVMMAVRHFLQRSKLDRIMLGTPDLVLIHPQSLGTEWCCELIRRRRLPTWLYIMDCSFFCVRSYNHLDGESDCCTRCVGGDWASREHHGCRPFPVTLDRYAEVFLDVLRSAVARGMVRFLSQNDRQAELVRKHFGNAVVVENVGLWTGDMSPVARVDSVRVAEPATVVFHGHPVSAKGFQWAIELARATPDIDYLFPCSADVLRNYGFCQDELPNCRFKPMEWGSGLSEHVAASRITLVPSLWSASIEGALIKSLFTAPAVAVVDIASAFSSELPSELLLRLHPDVKWAAGQVRDAVATGWRPEPAVYNAWRAAFVRSNRNILRRIIDVCRHYSKGDSIAK